MARPFTVINADGCPPLDVHTLHPRPGAAVVTVRGEIDLVTAPRLADELNALCRTPHHQVLIDLRGVDFLSVRGVTVLLDLEQHCRAVSTRLSVIASPVVRRVFERLGLAGRFGMTERLRLVPLPS